MARRSPQTFQKRQREQKRALKARQKLAKREARKSGLPDDPALIDGETPDEGAEEIEGAESADTTDDSVPSPE